MERLPTPPYLIVDDAYAPVMSVVDPGDPVLQRTERFACKRLTPFHPLMNLQLELRELRLPEQRGAHAIQIVDQQGEPYTLVGHRLQHMFHQHRLVERRGDLGDEDGIV